MVAQRTGPADQPTRPPPGPVPAHRRQPNPPLASRPIPQPPVPELLSELFSEQLGYPIVPADIGLEETDQHELGLRYSESIAATVVAAAELVRYDVRRRGFLHKGAFLAVAAVAPSRDWLLAALDATEPRPHSRVGLVQVCLIREAFADSQEADVMRGGGYARRALAEYVTERVLPLLYDTNPDSEAGTALFTAASEQIWLLGYMAFDDDHHALAQRYFIQSLRLAQEKSGDATSGAHILACMGEQALLLGYPAKLFNWADTFITLARPVEAVRFARRAISAAADKNRARRGAFSQAALSQAALTRRDLDTALRAAYQAVDLSTTMQSARCLAAVRDLQTRMGPYHKLATVREFDDYAREALTGTSRS